LAVGACGDPSPPDPRGAGEIEVSGAVVAQPVLGEQAALYFTVSNAGAAPDTIMEVDAGDLGVASLHRSDTQDGIMRMRPAGPVEIPANGRVDLRPGGLHVMIEDLTHTLAEGDTVVVTVRTARGGPMSVQAIVVPYSALLDYLETGG